MPKAAGSDLKTVRAAPRPAPASRGIMHQVPPPAPLVPAMSPGSSKFADQVKPAAKPKSGNIDPTQQRY
jgi:hypothetical protein